MRSELKHVLVVCIAILLSIWNGSVHAQTSRPALPAKKAPHPSGAAATQHGLQPIRLPNWRPSGLKASTATVSRTLSQAVTCRELSRLHTLAKVSHQASCELLKQVTQSPDGTPAQKAVALSGLAQCRGLSILANNAYRNVVPLIPWMTTPGLELYEYDNVPYDPALRASFQRIVPVLREYRYAQLPLLVRCRGDLRQGSSPQTRKHNQQIQKLCKIARNRLFLMTQQEKLFPVFDDTATRLGISPTLLGQVGTLPSPHQTQIFQQRTGWVKSIVVDIHLAPIAHCPQAIARVNLHAWLWDLKQGGFQRLAESRGTRIDARPIRFADWPIWTGLILFLIIFGYFFPVFAFDRKKTTLIDRLISVGVANLLCIIILLAYPQFVRSLFQGLLLPLDMHARSPTGAPIVWLWYWPLLVGFFLYVIPVVLTILLSTLLQPRLEKQQITGIQWGYLVPILQLGAGIGIAAEVPYYIGWEGCLWAALLGFPPALLGWGTTRAIHNFTDVTPDRGRVVLPLTLGAVLWIIYLPILSFMNLNVAYGMSLACILLAGVNHWLALPIKHAETEEEWNDETLSLAGAKGGSIAHPLYVSHGERDPAFCSNLLESQGMFRRLVFVGKSGVGKSRTASEVVTYLKTHKARNVRVGHATGEGGEEGPTRTYGFVADLIKIFYDLGSRKQRVESREKELDAINQLVQSLDGLPGISLLLGDKSNDKAPDKLTTGWLARDVAEALIQNAKENPVILVLDDAHNADRESLRLLAQVAQKLELRSQELLHPITWLVCHHPAKNQEKLEEIGLNAIVEGLETVTLQSFEYQTAMHLVAATNITSTPDAIVWLLDNTDNQTPSEILSLLAHLSEVELLTKQGDEQWALPSVDVLNEHKEAIPDSFVERQKQHLQRQNKDVLFTLMMAAQCGRQFSPRILAAGLLRPPLEILRMLREIHIEEDLIEDLEQEDLFQFTSETTRRALLEMSRKNATSGDSDWCEVVREFHYLIARELLTQAEQASHTEAERLLWHCEQAGKRMHNYLINAALHAANQARQLFVWPRVLHYVQIARRYGFQNEHFEGLREQFDFLEALARQGRGGQENRDKALAMLRPLLHSPSLPEYEILTSCLEIQYASKSMEDLEELQDWMQQLQDKSDWRDPLSPLSLQLYQALTARVLDQENPEPALLDLVNKLRELPNYGKNRDLLLARTLQSLADWSLAQGEVVREDVEAYLEESFQLKELHGDLAGQALTLGVRGNFHLFRLKEYDRARILFLQDLGLLQKMGDEGSVCGLKNRIGMATFGLAKQQETEEEQQTMRAEALRYCRESLTESLRLQQVGDIVFAAKSVLSYAPSIMPEDSEELEEAFQALENQDLWLEFYRRGWIAGELEKMLEELPTPTMQQRLEAVVQLIRDIDAKESAKEDS